MPVWEQHERLGNVLFKIQKLSITSGCVAAGARARGSSRASPARGRVRTPGSAGHMPTATTAEEQGIGVHVQRGRARGGGQRWRGRGARAQERKREARQPSDEARGEGNGGKEGEGRECGKGGGRGEAREEGEQRQDSHAVSRDGSESSGLAWIEGKGRGVRVCATWIWMFVGEEES
ncbi:hypothetical protein DFH09DRAFT_1071713 [Mycena vulgaris]|nr:hypothetical protein DFH09DRAFT_1071713 [Mycena vulgaris]